MAIILGKRKRHAIETQNASQKGAKMQARETEGSEDEDMARALFQKAFEAKFRPLMKAETPQVDVDEEDCKDGNEDEGEGEPDWDGISDGEDEVIVVEHAVPDLKRAEEPQGGKKSFMSSRPPVSAKNDKAGRTTSKVTPKDEDGTESANLKHDLDLQRLLKESHLLDPSSFHRSTGPEGKDRLKALDMRLQSLGAKKSLLQQENMPLAHRRGIARKKSSREASRRREAAENGVVLERARSVAKSQKKRERGIGDPGVGKFRGGTLRLSSRDVAGIQGVRSGRGGRRGGRRGGKR